MLPVYNLHLQLTLHKLIVQWANSFLNLCSILIKNSLLYWLILNVPLVFLYHSHLYTNPSFLVHRSENRKVISNNVFGLIKKGIKYLDIKTSKRVLHNYLPKKGSNDQFLAKGVQEIFTVIATYLSPNNSKFEFCRLFYLTILYACIAFYRAPTTLIRYIF